jgi:hypothetical protein
MSVAEKALRSFLLHTPMTATLRLDGKPVGLPIRVQWVERAGEWSFDAVVKSSGYLRMDEMVVVAEGDVLLTHRESLPLTLPPSSEYRVTFIVGGDDE